MFAILGKHGICFKRSNGYCLFFNNTNKNISHSNDLYLFADGLYATMYPWKERKELRKKGVEEESDIGLNILRSS